MTMTDIQKPTSRAALAAREFLSFRIEKEEYGLDLRSRT